MKRLLIAPVLLCVLALTGCTPVERDAYDIIVTSKAALVSFRSQHPECMFDATSGISKVVTAQPCLANNKLTAAKDTLIDATEVYCSSPAFESGGACTPPAKGTPALQQATDKLKAAIANYNQTAADLKGVI